MTPYTRALLSAAAAASLAGAALAAPMPYPWLAFVAACAALMLAAGRNG